MKTLRLYLLLSAVSILGTSVLTGCYTQLATREDEPETVVDTEPIAEAPPPIIIIEPIYVPILPPYCPPSGAVQTPSVGTQQPNPIRDIGNQRSGSGRSDAAGSSSNIRISGSTRGGR